MKQFGFVSTLLVFLMLNVKSSFGFIPAAVLEDVLNLFDDTFLGKFGYVSDSVVHEEIIHEGLLNSVIKYFSEQPNGSSRIDLNNTNRRYYIVRNLYRDYYGTELCNIEFETVLEEEIKIQVASVDFNSLTKDMPYAHFDAETFVKSNDRVISFTEQVYSLIRIQDYKKARELASQILHTIHDFYSHSNWVEMGNRDINRLIGTTGFNVTPIVTQSDTSPCVNNCRLVQVNCSKTIETLVGLLNNLNFKTPITCPLKYYNCTGSNIVLLNKLVSGFYGGQKLPDGTSVPKPLNTMKCSHGGVMDSSASIPAQGGINKDSGFYLFSPRADLHLEASRLAIKHTEFYFNEIRKNIGDEEFANFLKLKPNEEELQNSRVGPVLCSSSSLKPFYYLSAFIVLVNHFLINHSKITF